MYAQIQCIAGYRDSHPLRQYLVVINWYCTYILISYFRSHLETHHLAENFEEFGRTYETTPVGPGPTPGPTRRGDPLNTSRKDVTSLVTPAMLREQETSLSH